MYYYELKQELIDNNIIKKEDMYLLEGKLLFTDRAVFECARRYLAGKNYQMVTGRPRNHSHWEHNFTDYIYFEGL